MVGMFPLMGSIWSGTDFGVLEVLFGHPSGHITEAIRFESEAQGRGHESPELINEQAPHLLVHVD